MFAMMALKCLKYDWNHFEKDNTLYFLLLFSHLADAFIQRKNNYNYKLKLYKYYIYTFKKMEKLN